LRTVASIVFSDWAIKHRVRIKLQERFDPLRGQIPAGDCPQPGRTPVRRQLGQPPLAGLGPDGVARRTGEARVGLVKRSRNLTLASWSGAVLKVFGACANFLPLTTTREWGEISELLIVDWRFRGKIRSAAFRYICWDSASQFLMPRQLLTPNQQSPIIPELEERELIRLRPRCVHSWFQLLLLGSRIRRKLFSLC
jgi:hypothetical protein